MTPLLALLAAVAAVQAPLSHPPSGARPDGVIVGVVAGTPEEQRVLGDTLGESLSRQGLTLTLTSKDHITPDDITRAAAPPEAAVARFWLDLTSPPLAKLYLTDGERRRVYVRWLSLARGMDPVAVELVRFVVESSIEAVRDGRDIGVSREEYETSIGAPVGHPVAASSPALLHLPPAAESPVQVVAVAAYEGTMLGSGRYQQGPSIAASLRLRRLWIGAGVHSRLPATIGDDTVAARLAVHGVRLTAALPVVEARKLVFALGAGLGIDVSRIRPDATDPGVVPAAPFWATTPVLRVFGSVERFFGRIVVAAVVGLDLDLLGERYVVTEPTTDRAAFVPWRFRPLLGLVLGARP